MSFGEIGDPGASGYRPPMGRQRYELSIKNVTGYWRARGDDDDSEEQAIPAFACCAVNVGAINTSDGGAYTSIERTVQEVERGRVVWWVDQPNGYTELRQDPRLLIINGPTPIPPGAIGRGTQAYPAQVLTNYYRGSGGVRTAHALPANGAAVGPKAGEWGVYLGRTAFTYISRDQTQSLARESGPRACSSGWIVPAGSDVLPLYQGSQSQSLQHIDAGEPLYLMPRDPLGSFTSSMVWSQPRPTHYGCFCEPGEAGGSTDDVAAWSTVEVYRDGVYWLAVAATLSSTYTPDNVGMGLGVYLRPNGDDDFALTYLDGARRQSIDEVQEPYVLGPTYYSAENVAFSGPLELEVGDQLQVRNTGSYQTTYTGFILAAHRFGYYSSTFLAGS